jgi:hypothetical protein
MELPALFYGLYRDVKPRTTRIIKRIPKGADWMALVEAEGFLDVAKTPGMILLDGPSPLVGGQPHFQAWLLWDQMFDKWREWGQGSKRGHFSEIADPTVERAGSRGWQQKRGLGLAQAPLPTFSPRRAPVLGSLELRGTTLLVRPADARAALVPADQHQVRPGQPRYPRRRSRSAAAARRPRRAHRSHRAAPALMESPERSWNWELQPLTSAQQSYTCCCTVPSSALGCDKTGASTLRTGSSRASKSGRNASAGSAVS